MNWTRRFVRENIDLLLSKDERKETLKLKKREFFHKRSLRSSDSFSFKDLALETVKYLMDVSKINSEEDLVRFVESSAFLSDYITEHRKNALVGLITPPKIAILKTGDLGKLKHKEFLRKKEHEFLEKARVIAESELEKERKEAMNEVMRERKKLEGIKLDVQKRIEQAERMKSILDNLPPKFDPQQFISFEEEKKPETPSKGLWWERLGVVDDPFPTNVGLYKIPKDMYEDIIVFTKIFGEYLDLIGASPQSLYGKTIILSGKFGSGKTTLFQYVSYKLAAHNILPFNIILDPVGDIDILRQNFYSQLLSVIGRTMSQRGLYDPRSMGLILNKATISDLLIELGRESQIGGFIIMIDGLHKGETTLITCLEFVKQLQNFHEYLNNYGVNVSILVAGSPLWLRKIKHNPAYSGSFYKIDEMPYLTFDNAYDLLYKRFKAFENPKYKIFFDKNAIRYAYDRVWSDLQEGITFRSFMDYIIPRLIRGEHKEVGISISIDPEDVQKIDDAVGKSIIADSYTVFKHLTVEKTKLRMACTYALIGIYKNKYLEEQNRNFLSNKGAFYVLKKSHLIQKVNINKNLGWTISNDLLAVLENLNEEGYPPEIVFKSMGMYTIAVPKRDVSDDPILHVAQDFLAKWESEWPEITSSVNNFLARHKKVVSYSISGDKQKLCNECKNALIELIECGQIIFNNSQTHEEWITSTWLDFPIKPTIMSILKSKDIPEKQKIDYYQRYHQSVTVILEKLGELLELNEISNILSSKNRREELRSLFNAGNYFQKGDLENAIEENNSMLENRIRVVFHLAFSLHYGNNYLGKLPTYIQTRILGLDKKGPVMLRRTVDKNLFYHFSRSEYAEVVNNNANWSLIFEKIFHPRKKEKVVEALQNTFALDNRKQHRDRKGYFREMREGIRKSLINADWLMFSLSDIIKQSMNPSGFIDDIDDKYHNLQISYAGQDKCSSSRKWKMEKTKQKEIASRLLNRDRKLNFGDDRSVSTILNGTLAEIFITISLLLKQKLISVQESTEGNAYFHITPKEQKPST